VGFFWVFLLVVGWWGGLGVLGFFWFFLVVCLVGGVKLGGGEGRRTNGLKFTSYKDEKDSQKFKKQRGKPPKTTTPPTVGR